jgi:short-subunit dehydrogenase
VKKKANPKTIVIVGATSSIAKAMLGQLLEAGTLRAHLIGRDSEALESLRMDMEIRYRGSFISTETTDLLDPELISQVAKRVSNEIKPEVVVIAHGTMPAQVDQQNSLTLAHYQMAVSGVSPVLWLEAFVNSLHSGIFAIFGSVAGDRGRKSNYFYGASKALIETVASGMQNRFGMKSNKTVVLLKPGPTKSKMTAHLELRKLAKTDQVAKTLISGLLSGNPVVYAPLKWRLIMLVIRLIPGRIFRRLSL